MTGLNLASGFLASQLPEHGKPALSINHLKSLEDFIPIHPLSAAWAAARRATGTLKGEQDT